MTIPEERLEAAVVVALRGTASIKKLSPSEVRAALEEGRNPVEVLRESADLVAQLADFDSPLDDAQKEIVNWREAGLDVMFSFNERYPRPLLQVYDYPPVIFGRGTHANDFDAIAIVGSRVASTKSLNLARALGRRLAIERVTVVSGLARGIDTAAHLGALEAGGRTVAVLGQGAGTPIYPKENAALARQILSEEGQTLSQFWPGSSPTKQTFPIRNVTMSGLSAVTAIVDAAEQSGTRHQAAAAVRHGRRVLLHESVVRQTSWGNDLVEKGLAEPFIGEDDGVELALQILRTTSSAGAVFA
ncbi:DNA-processing protein DprA [Labedella endophytica]|nr:DNA-processing protein DprA [Labedella endophytica]